jgi:hypothetical protein
MARDENPPVERGATYFAGRDTDTDSFANMEGHKWRWEDTLYGTGFFVDTVLVRNTSGVTLQGKRLAVFDSANFGRRLAGYAATTAAPHAVVIDDALGANGVPNNDLCWVIVRGPCLVKTDLAGGAANVIAAGDQLAGITAATTGAVTAGRVQTVGITAATINRGIVATALSAATTGQTDASILAFVSTIF